MVPNFKALINSQKVWIVNFITSFDGNDFIRTKGNKILLINLGLKKDRIFVDNIIRKILI